jgi:putative flippase GtrA
LTQVARGWLFGSGHILAKAIRFSFVGVLSGAIFAIVTALLVSGLGAPPIPASIAGYCASVPVSFLGHRAFSFRSNGQMTTDAVRFVLAQALNMAVTAGSMHMSVNWLGAQYYWGLVVAVVLVPIANFAFMNLWVFRQQGNPERVES